jgi:O-antigen ligase
VTTTIGRSTSGLFLGAVAVVSVLGLGFALVFMKMPPLTILGLVAGMITVTISAFRPYLGVHVIVALLFIEGATVMPEGATALQIFGLLILTGWMAQSLTQRRLRVQIGPQMLLVFAYLVWGSMCVLKAYDVHEALTRMGTYGMLSVTALMVASVVNTTERLRRLFTALALWIGLAGSIAIVMYYAGSTIVAQGFVGNRNVLALYCNIGLAGAFLLQTITRAPITKILLFAALPIMLLTLGLTLSRTGLVIMFGALTVVGYRLLRQRGVMLLLGGAVAIVVLAVVLPSSFWSRAGTILPSIERRQDTFGMRVRLWEAGVRMVEDRPIFGVGPGNFRLVLARYARGSLASAQLNAHNAYVVVAAETGLPGLALFVSIMIAGMVAARRVAVAAHAAGREDLALAAFMIQLLTFIVLCTGITMTVEGLKILWILVGAGQALVGIARAELSQAGAVEPALALNESVEATPA